MSRTVTSGGELSSEWFTATFPLECRRVHGEFVPIGWTIGSRVDGSVVTAMRVIECGDDAFVVEIAQGEQTLEAVNYPAGVGIPLRSVEHLEQLVDALQLEYSR